jgi:predicted acyl esterase
MGQIGAFSIIKQWPLRRDALLFGRRSIELIGITNMRSIAIERDLAVPIRDGARLVCEPVPVIMSVTPYGRDKPPDRIATFFMRLSGIKFGKLNCSRLTGFESPDPVYWVQQGYAVLQADVRGMHKSEEQAGVLTPMSPICRVHHGRDAAHSTRS